MRPEDARAFWCPFARAQAPQVSEHGVVTGAVTVNRGPDGTPDRDCMCIGPACMAWRWRTVVTFDRARSANGIKTQHGYCGLAGRPQETKDHD